MKEIIKANTAELRSLFEGISNLPKDRYDEGYSEGYDKGLSERQSEIWTVTLADGTVVEKEVALL